MNDHQVDGNGKASQGAAVLVRTSSTLIALQGHGGGNSLHRQCQTPLVGLLFLPHSTGRELRDREGK